MPPCAPLRAAGCDNAYPLSSRMDLTVWLKALRKARDETARVVQQLRTQAGLSGPRRSGCDYAHRSGAARHDNPPAGACTYQRAAWGRDPAPAGGPAAAVAAGGTAGGAGAAVAAVEGRAAAPRGHTPG